MTNITFITDPIRISVDAYSNIPKTDADIAKMILSRVKNKLKKAPGYGWCAWDGLRWYARGDKRDPIEVISKAAIEFYDEFSADADRIKKERDVDKPTVLVSLDGREVAPEQYQKDLEARQKQASDLVTYANSANGAQAISRFLWHMLETVKDFDKYAWALNTPTGTIRLRDGAVYGNNPSYLQTRITACSANRNWRGGIWDKTVSSTFSDDELRDYIHRLIGYCSTGHAHYEVAHMFRGEHGCGKGTFIEPILAALGDYAVKCKSELIVRGGRSHTSFEAMLQGSRLAIINEIEDHAHLEESRYKELVDCGQITSRRLFEEPHSFPITWKILMTFNSLPAVSSNDGSIKRRTRIIEMAPRSGPVDIGLKSRLISKHLDEVLGWVVDGAIAFYERGLDMPKCVQDWTDEFFETVDPVLNFLRESCVLGDEHLCAPKDLYKHYVHVTKDANGKPFGKQGFNRQVSNLGYRRRRIASGEQWIGIGMPNACHVCNGNH